MTKTVNVSSFILKQCSTVHVDKALYLFYASAPRIEFGKIKQINIKYSQAKLCCHFLYFSEQPPRLICGSNLLLGNRSKTGSHFVFLRLLRGEQYLLLTSKLANHNARKALFTCAVCINMCYYYYACSRDTQIQFTYTGKHCDIHFMSKVSPLATLNLVTFFFVPKTMWSHPGTKKLQKSCPTT